MAEVEQWSTTKLMRHHLEANRGTVYDVRTLAKELIEQFKDLSEQKRVTRNPSMSDLELEQQVYDEIYRSLSEPNYSRNFADLKILQQNPKEFVLEKSESFMWVNFYEKFANQLSGFASKRDELISMLVTGVQEVDALRISADEYPEGGNGFWRDVCPFTFMACFNRGNTNEKRKEIANSLARQLGVDIPAPESYVGVPQQNSQNWWFFAWEKNRKPQDIQKLWNLFLAALDLADGKEDSRPAFIKALDDVAEVSRVDWNITLGLFWIRPDYFPPLDIKTRRLITKLGFDKGYLNSKKMIPAEQYLEIRDNLADYFKGASPLVRRFPELSAKAYSAKSLESETVQENLSPNVAYEIENIMRDGSFVSRERLEELLISLEEKKNLILQGVPGSGKSWLARRLAYALIGERDPDRVLATQFHVNLSYEDFVRGWRPSAAGKLELVDGPFIQMIERAKESPQDNFVVVIEEINRGNPAQIFGELLTLLEVDKRTEEESLKITYLRPDELGVYVPENLFVLGTMNLADRSLAVMDFAFRRRFSFEQLLPTFNEPWRQWLKSLDVREGLIELVAAAVAELNEAILRDPNLGSNYMIGHSFFTPHTKVEDSDAWVKRIFNSEIKPMLQEYWFDDMARAEELSKAFALKVGLLSE